MVKLSEKRRKPLRSRHTYPTVLTFGLLIPKSRGLLRSFQSAPQKARGDDIPESTRQRQSQSTIYGQLPVGGIRELYKLVTSKSDWAFSLTKQDFEMTKKTYNMFTEWMYSVFMVTMFQGRNSEFEDMKYSQRRGLLQANGHELSTNFKTALSYTYQAVSSSELVSKVVYFYLVYARPTVAISNDLYDDAAPLFLSSTGKKETQFGFKVTNFFGKVSKYHITTTAIRMLYDTEASELCSKNE